jgi:TonB family protein
MKHAWVVILFVLASLLARPLLAQTGDDETPPTLCVDIHDKTRAGSLAFIEMKRWIPYIFDELMGNRLQITGSRSVTVDFGIDADKQPTNIHISQSSGHAIVDQLAIDAVKRAAPYRESGGCFKITLTYTYQADKPGSGTVGESESIGQGSNTLNGMTFRVNDHVPNQVMELGAGDDTYSFPTTVTGQDFIDDTSGKADALIFGQKKLTEAQLQAQDGPDPDANIDCLWINFGSGNSITIYHYFDNSTRSLADIKPGNGLLETIAFQWDDKTL